MERRLIAQLNGLSVDLDLHVPTSPLSGQFPAARTLKERDSALDSSAAQNPGQVASGRQMKQIWPTLDQTRLRD
jgi:hypothetical protein